MGVDRKHLCEDGHNQSDSSNSQQNLPDQSIGWTWLIFLAGFSTTVGSAFPIGFTIGVLNTPSAIIQKWVNSSIISRYDVVVDDNVMEMIWSAIVSVFLVGGMIGSLSGGWMADKLGRKGALLLGGGVSFLTSVMFILTVPLNSVELFFIARLVIGLSGGLIMPVMPLYLTELAPIRLKGAVGALCPLGLCSGLLIAQIIGFPQFLGTETSWPYLVGFFGIFNVIGYLAFPWLPESPKYLYLIRGSRDGALKALSRLRNLPEDLVCCELEEKVETSKEDVWTVGRLLRSREHRINLALVCALHFGQQFSGINAVFYYSVIIFKKAGLSEQNAQLGNLGAGMVNLLMSATMIPLLNVFSRRGVTLTSCSLAAAFLVFLSFTIHFMHSYTWMPYLSIVAVLGYVFTYGIGLGPIPFFIGTELFEVGPRPVAMALGTTSNWIGNLSVGLFFPVMQRAIGHYSFLVFAVTASSLALFVKICMPETNALILAKRERKNSLAKI